MSTISFRLESLDISHNPEITIEGYKFLTETLIMNQKYSEFKSLNIEGNMIGDLVLNQLIDGLIYNRSIRFLNLSHNKITAVGARFIKHYLIDNSTIKVLLLHWNRFGAKGSKRIAKALVSN